MMPAKRSIFKAVVSRVRKGKNAVGSKYTRYWKNPGGMKKSLGHYAEKAADTTIIGMGYVSGGGIVMAPTAVATAAATVIGGPLPGVLVFAGGTALATKTSQAVGRMARKVVRGKNAVKAAAKRQGISHRQAQALHETGTKKFNKFMKGP